MFCDFKCACGAARHHGFERIFSFEQFIKTIPGESVSRARRIDRPDAERRAFYIIGAVVIYRSAAAESKNYFFAPEDSEYFEDFDEDDDEFEDSDLEDD